MNRPTLTSWQLVLALAILTAGAVIVVVLTGSAEYAVPLVTTLGVILGSSGGGQPPAPPAT